MQDECHFLWGDILGYVWGSKGIPIQIPVINERCRQTYYGVINYLTHEVIAEEYSAGNTENTIEFIKLLRKKCGDSRLLIIWDGASYHKSKELKEYLSEVNDGLEEDDWAVTCMLFAPNAPDQNVMEDVWLQGKNYIRRNFLNLKTFSTLKESFQEYLEEAKFNFEKLYIYGRLVQMT